MAAPGGQEAERLKTALNWLKSHHKRLQIDRRSLEDQLGRLVPEIERIEREIERAEGRYRDLAGR
jgi:chromosome segregation ATPase